MFHSAEIRWFFEGSADAEVEAWFRASPLAKDEDTRIDTYLLMPGCPTCSVKIRQGHVEVKAEVTRPEPIAYGNGLAGRRSSWVKWASGIAGAPILEERRGPEHWVQVEKSRILRLFAADGAVSERPADERLEDAGCQVELSSVRVAGEGDDWQNAEHWWSVCLEAFAEPPTVMATLDRVASTSQLQPLAARLPREGSMSYPEWLSR